MCAEKLIGKFEIQMIAPDCTPGASWWGVKVHIGNDISEVMPYLNAELEDTNYNRKAKTLLWDSRKEGIRYAFRPNEISIAPIEDRELAEKICDNIINLVCDTWTRRDKIEPDFTGKAPPPNMVTLLKLLPGTNCKECGCATCMAFAATLIQGQAELAKCPHLSQESNRELSVILGK